MKFIVMSPPRAGDGKSTRSLEETIKAVMEAERNPGQMKIRKCGATWACCTGDCGNCLVARMTISNRTEPSHAQTYSTSTRIKED